MTGGKCVTADDALYWDPYDSRFAADPWPVFNRIREEAPLYYNEPHDFYAVSRFADVERGFLDPKTFISGRGGIIELIRANIEMPSGVLIFEDPPVHTIHRRLMSRVFSPNRVAALEPQISWGTDPSQVIGISGRVPEPGAVELAIGVTRKPFQVGLSINNQGKIFLDTVPVTLQELEQRLGQAKQAGDFPIVIKGDSETQYQGVMDVLDVLGRLGLSQVGLATKKRAGP